MILHVLIAMVAGWLQRHQQQVITYLQEENRVLKAQLGGRRLRLTDTERRRLAALAHPLGRQRLKAMATLITPDTLLRWYHRLIAQKFDGSTKRRPLGRPRVAEEVEQLVMRMAEENLTRGGIAVSRGLWRTWATPLTKLRCVTSCNATIWIPLPNAGRRG
jgi:putative transposase